MKILALVLALVSPVLATGADYAEKRMAMTEEIREFAKRAGDEPFSDSVMQALESVERHKFVPADVVPFAYENHPLPIGQGQTISQPYIVALMTDLLKPGPEDVILEVGTGSGYQAAVLAEIVKHVYSIEIVEVLAAQASERLQRLGYDNVTTKAGDGYAGWREHAPFDGIIVTAAPGHVPLPLVEQLRPGGRMVIPVGSSEFAQQLMLIEKTDDGETVTKAIAPVRFVPLTGDR